MNKTEILNIVNEPSKHIQIVKIDGKDSIVYSSKFVELLELIPTMLTKADLKAILVELQLEIEEMTPTYHNPDWSLTDLVSISEVNDKIIQQRIKALGGDD